MKEKKEVKTVGFGFCEALALLFIALKLCKVIAWSWLWVLCPLWLGFALVLLVVIIAALVTK